MRVIWTLVCLYLAAFTFHVNATDLNDCSTSYDICDHSNSIAVTLDQIYLTKDGMFLYIDGELMPIDSLYFDSLGQYKCDFHNTIPDHVTCPRCGTVYNRTYNKRCPNVGCPTRRPHGPQH